TLLEIETTPKRIFFTSQEETLLNDFCYKEVTLILDYLHAVFKAIQTEFPQEVKAMTDVFESIESDLNATWKQNKILNNQLLEATCWEIDCKRLNTGSITVKSGSMS
ncbi:hypothetical protein Tco_0107911, partial [Tanacetum coccineum]